MGLSIKLQSADESDAALAESVTTILDETRLLGLATINPDGSPAACNAFFAYDSECRLYILTPPSTRHIQNILSDDRVAVLVSDSQQTGDGGKRGLQIAGRAALAVGEELAEGLSAYRERFPSTGTALASEEALQASGWESRIYVVRPEKISIFDERRFGVERWIEASVG